MGTFGQRLRELRKQRGISQNELSKYIGVSKSSVNMYERDEREPGFETLEAIADFFNVNMDYLLGRKDTDNFSESDIKAAFLGCSASDLSDEELLALWDDAKNYIQQKLAQKKQKVREPCRLVSHDGLVELKVYDQPAAAGLGNDLDEPNYHLKLFPAHLVPPGTDFGVLIDGDSMEPRYHNGYTAFIQSTQMVESGEIGLFLLNSKSFIKRLSNDPFRQQTRLISINPAYEPIVIGEYDNYRPLGRVLGQHKTDE